MPNSARPVADGGNLDATRLRALRSRQLWDQLPDRSALMFDRDLRLLLSEGTTLRRSGRVDAEAAADAGVTADAEIGAPLTDVLSAHAMAFVEAHCRAATSGVAADLKYPHPQMGRKIRLRTGPLTGPDGTIVGGFVVTDGVSEWAQGSTIQADLEHTRLLRGIGDALAGPRLAGADLLQNVAERASVALDSVAFLRLLSPNLDAIERDLVAHPVEQIRRNVEVAMRRSSQSFEPGTPVHDQVIRRGTLLSTIGPQEVPPESLRLVHGQIEWNAEHFVVAPVRHDGQVLGVFGVFRTDIEAPYAPGDDDLVQVLADSIGSAIAESRAGAATEKEQCELLEHLATTESRERSMLAEALHDDPLQLVVAAILRIDNLRLRTDSGQEEQLEQVADMLETAVERMRKLIVAVTPPDFELGLGVALENLAEGIFTGTPCTVSTVGLMHVALTPSTKSAAYRILREALINVRKHARARTVIIRLAQVDGLVTVSITDDGVGSSTIEAVSGHLGVSSMRRRASAENGSLRIDSAPGQGTTVTLTLPAAAAGRSVGPRPLTVFLVDDHEVTRRGVADLLQAEGDLSVVGQASSYSEAIALAPRLRPDIAILDVRLPDGNGVDLCRELRANLPGLTCLMLTSYVDEQARADSVEAGASGYVLKNIMGMDLADAVRTVATGRLLPGFGANPTNADRSPPAPDELVQRAEAEQPDGTHRSAGPVNAH